LALTGFLATQSIAQKDQTHATTGGATIGQMVSQHQRMSGLMSKLMQSMSVMQAENNPEALAQELSDHNELAKADARPNDARGQNLARSGKRHE
jgi:hypothetical protein